VRRPILGLLACAFLATLVLASYAVAGDGRTCGHMLVRPPANGNPVWSANEVTATGVSCVAARSLVRAWDIAVDRRQIPERVLTVFDKSNTLVVGRFGPRYRFDGYTCRWMSLLPPPGAPPYLRGAGRCRRGSATVSWSFRVALNPSQGKVIGCQRPAPWKHGVAANLRVRGTTCASARHVLTAALNHHAIRLVRGRLVPAAHPVDGYTFSQRGEVFVARRGRALITFSFCWFNVNC
jgi:hypothetical protein